MLLKAITAIDNDWEVRIFQFVGKTEPEDFFAGELTTFERQVDALITMRYELFHCLPMREDFPEARGPYIHTNWHWDIYSICLRFCSVLSA